MRFENPLIYTPGDNEWTDCWEPNELNPSAGYFKPEERLKQLRQVFFKDDKSLGKKSLKLVRQSEIDADHSVYVENRQWMYGDVLFFTMNIPGSNNGWVLGSDSLDSEFNNRQSANIAWLRRSFKLADSLNAQAVVMFYHADLDPVYPKNYPELRPIKFRRHQLGTVDGFEDIRTEIRKYSESFSGQVLQVYGDSHQFTFTSPYQGVQNVWRLQTFGYPDHKAVVVKVNSSKPWCFEAVPLFK